MIKAVLTEAQAKEALHTHRGYDDEPVLVTTSHHRYASTFASAARTTAGTTTIASVQGDQAIALTDLIVTTDRVNGGVVTIQFTDGTNTVVVMSAKLTDAPCNLAMPFMGNWEGWKNTRIDLVVTGSVSVTASIGYFKVPETKALAYDAWVLRR